MNHTQTRADAPTFEVKNLHLWYISKDEKALDGVDIRIFDSQINIILGQNGSGKSSLLKCLAGIQRWNEGDIFRNGASRSLDLKDFNADQILVSEDISLPLFSLSDLAKIYSDIWPKFDEAVFRQIISIGDISVEKKSSQLSRGQKILTQFALGLATGCRIILIDEVTATLDPYVRGRLAEELIAYQKKHAATIVLATNIATEFQVDVRLILLKRGKVYLQGSLEDLAKEFTKFKAPKDKMSGASNMVPLQTLPDGGQRVICRKQDGSTSSGFEVDSSPISMEEIFVYLSYRGDK